MVGQPLLLSRLRLQRSEPELVPLLQHRWLVLLLQPQRKAQIAVLLPAAFTNVLARARLITITGIAEPGTLRGNRL